MALVRQPNIPHAGGEMFNEAEQPMGCNCHVTAAKIGDSLESHVYIYNYIYIYICIPIIYNDYTKIRSITWFSQEKWGLNGATSCSSLGSSIGGYLPLPESVQVGFDPWNTAISDTLVECIWAMWRSLPEGISYSLIMFHSLILWFNSSILYDIYIYSSDNINDNIELSNHNKIMI